MLVLEHTLSSTDFKFTNQRTVTIGRVDKANTELFDNRKKISTEKAFRGSSITNTFHATSRWSESLISSCESEVI